MSINDDPFQENAASRPEKEKDRLEALESEPPATEEDDVIELTDAAGDEEVLGLEETVESTSEEEDIIDLMDTDLSSLEENEGIIELESGGPLEEDAEEEILELKTEAVTETDDDEDLLDLTDEVEPEVTDEGKEIMELIDDIQSTLNETGQKEADQESIATAAVAEEPPDSAEESGEKSIIMGDEETLEPVELSDSESEFVDHIGLDLTSEFSKEIFGEESSASAAAIDLSKLEQIIERVVNKMLSQENSPLARAIVKAIQKEIGNNNG